VGGADQQKAPLLVLPRDLGEEVDSDVFRDEVPQRAVVRQAIARERADVATVWTFRRIDLDDGRVSEQELVDALPALSSFFERPAGRDGRRDGGTAGRRDRIEQSRCCRETIIGNEARWITLPIYQATRTRRNLSFLDLEPP